MTKVIDVSLHNRRATDRKDPPALGDHYTETAPYLDITFALDNAPLDSAVDTGEATWKSHLVSCVNLWNALTKEQEKKTVDFWKSAQSIAPTATSQNVSGS